MFAMTTVARKMRKTKNDPPLSNPKTSSITSSGYLLEKQIFSPFQIF